MKKIMVNIRKDLYINIKKNIHTNKSLASVITTLAFYSLEFLEQRPDLFIDNYNRVDTTKTVGVRFPIKLIKMIEDVKPSSASLTAYMNMLVETAYQIYSFDTKKINF